MKLSKTFVTLLFVLSGSWAMAQDANAKLPDLYEKIIKQDFDAANIPIFVLDSKVYHFDVFNNKDFLAAVSSDEKAAKMFEETLKQKNAVFTAGLFTVGFYLGELGTLIYDYTLPGGSSERRTYAWATLGLAVGGIVTTNIGEYFANLSNRNEANAVNTYNQDVLRN